MKLDKSFKFGLRGGMLELAVSIAFLCLKGYSWGSIGIGVVVGVPSALIFLYLFNWVTSE